MTIDKAIENLHFLSTAGAPKLRLDEIVAIKLGIEALKAWQSSRQFSSIHHVPLLPGETPIIDNTRSEHAIKKILESPLARPDGD